MAGKKNRFRSSSHGEGYTPEWATEFDTAFPEQRSDSERFDHAVEMGVEAAQELERDEALGIISPRKSGRRRFGTVLVVGVLVLAGFGISYIANYDDSDSSAKQEQVAPEFITPKKQADGSFDAHVVLEDKPNGETVQQKVKIPEKIIKSGQPWAMRIHVTMDTTSDHMAMCKPTLHYNAFLGEGTVYYDDECKTVEEDSSKKEMMWRSAVGADERLDPSVFRASTADKVYQLPARFPTKRAPVYPNGPKEITPHVLFVGGAVQIDVEFVPVSDIAVQWDRFEPLKGDESTFVAFSGSLDGLTLQYDVGSVKFYAYKPDFDGTEQGEGLYLFNPYNNSTDVGHGGSNCTDKVNCITIKDDVAKKLRLSGDDASGYLFIDVDSATPVGWQLD